MKATLSVSGRGLIALPAKMREAAGMRPLDNLIAETTAEGILLRPAVTVPIEIYSDERIAEFDQAEAELADCVGAPAVKGALGTAQGAGEMAVAHDAFEVGVARWVDAHR